MLNNLPERLFNNSATLFFFIAVIAIAGYLIWFLLEFNIV